MKTVQIMIRKRHDRLTKQIGDWTCTGLLLWVVLTILAVVLKAPFFFFLYSFLVMIVIFAGALFSICIVLLRNKSGYVPSEFGGSAYVKGNEAVILGVLSIISAPILIFGVLLFLFSMAVGK